MTDDTFNLQVPIPRNPAEYRATSHFMNRYKYRKHPAISNEVVPTCLESGDLKHTADADRRMFEAFVDTQLGDEIRPIRWRVIVRLVEDAFLNEEFKHEILTAYAPDYHEKDSAY